MRRATHEADPWSGHVAFPGGRAESGDTSLLDTAIRETREEAAVDLTSARVLGALDELRPRIAVLPPIIVRPFVMTLPALPDVAAGPEVAELFWAPTDALFDGRSAVKTRVQTRGMAMTVDAIGFDGRTIWGITERIIRSLQHVWTGTPASPG
jgi:8-oxo-dGTP pyrophosphatase MutT (NUDIX family)